MPGVGSKTAGDAFAAIAMCREAEELLRQAISRQSTLARQALLMSAIQVFANANRTIGNFTGAIEAYGRLIGILDTIRSNDSRSAACAAAAVGIAYIMNDRAVCRRQAS